MGTHIVVAAQNADPDGVHIIEQESSETVVENLNFLNFEAQTTEIDVESESQQRRKLEEEGEEFDADREAVYFSKLHNQFEMSHWLILVGAFLFWFLLYCCIRKCCCDRY